MIKRAIKNINKYVITDEITSNTFYGCDQEWYTHRWQRMAGCGPTVSANIISYLGRKNIGSEDEIDTLTKNECVSLMEDIWQYVTPTLHGVNTTKILYNGVMDYARDKSLNMTFDYIDIPKKPRERPEFDSVLSFLGNSLSNDSPVAFLNLNNGGEPVLDSWHWVTLISLEYEEDCSFASAEILDEGVVKRIDLRKWFFNTSLGGGFVSFRHIDDAANNVQ
jgi:hypothetical protein